MHTATLPASHGVADRILSFGANLSARQQSILNAMVVKGRPRLARAETRMSAADASEVLAERAKSGMDNQSAWTFDIWKHSF